MKYLIAIMLPHDLSAKITALQREYGPSHWHIRVAPHITLVHRGNFSGAEIELVNRLRDVAAYHDPFSIMLKGIDSFGNQFQVVHIPVIPNPSLTKLQQDLVEAIQPFFISENHYSTYSEYRPHVTVANRLSEKEAVPILSEIKMSQFEFEMSCSAFTILKYGPKDERWREVTTLMLGK